MTKQKKLKKTKSPAIAGRLPLREVADEQQDSGGDTPQKEKKSSSRLAKASLEEEPEEEEEYFEEEEKEEEDTPHDSPQLEKEISSQQESPAHHERETSPIKTNSSAPPPSGVQDLLKRRREKLQARKRCAKRGGAFQDSDSEDSEDLEDDDFFFPVIDETLGDHALPRAVLFVDRPPTAKPQEVKNEKVLDDIVDRFKDYFLSHWDKQLFEFVNSKLVTNRFKLGDADDAEFHHRYTTGMPELFHGNQRRGIISIRQFLPTLFDGVHHSRLGALLNAFYLQVRFFVNDCCPKEHLIFKAFYQAAWMVKLQIFCDNDARLVKDEFEHPNNVSPLVKLVIHPKWDHATELVSRSMSAAAAKEKRERNSGLGKYPDWMVDRDVVRANIHAPRSQRSDRSSAEPSRLDMDVEEPPPQVMPTRDFLSPGVNMSVGVTGSSSQTTSLLVSAAELPTFTVVTPGSREFTKLLTYPMHECMCENQGQDLRIDKWPRLLRSNMNTQYRFNFCMAEGNSHRQDEWQSFSASQLRECLEKMTPGYRSHYTEDPFAEFSRWLG